jgi:hypothetical protein
MWSADLTPRERLLPPWLIGMLGALIGLALALMFPRERLEARLLKAARSMPCRWRTWKPGCAYAPTTANS